LFDSINANVTRIIKIFSEGELVKQKRNFIIQTRLGFFPVHYKEKGEDKVNKKKAGERNNILYFFKISKSNQRKKFN